MKVYVDTNVYLDFILNRSDKLRPLGELASQFFRRALDCEFEIVVSNHVISELKKNDIKDDELEDLWLWLKSKIVKVGVSFEDEERARTLHRSGLLHFQDALHYSIAQKVKAIILTNDKDFQGMPAVKGYSQL